MIRYLAGVRGVGKTTLVGPLVSALPGYVVLDMDEVLDDDRGVLGVPIACDEGAPHWPAYNRLWVRIAGLVARSSPLVLLGPLLPDEWRTAGGTGDVAFALLDCDDALLRERLTTRGYAASDVDDALEDAAAARAAIPTRIVNDGSIDGAIASIVAWVRNDPPDAASPT